MIDILRIVLEGKGFSNMKEHVFILFHTPNSSEPLRICRPEMNRLEVQNSSVRSCYFMYNIYIYIVQYILYILYICYIYTYMLYIYMLYIYMLYIYMLFRCLWILFSQETPKWHIQRLRQLRQLRALLALWRHHLAPGNETSN